MIDDSFASIIRYLCPQINIDDIFDAVGACAVCNVDESWITTGLENTDLENTVLTGLGL